MIIYHETKVHKPVNHNYAAKHRSLLVLNMLCCSYKGWSCKRHQIAPRQNQKLFFYETQTSILHIHLPLPRVQAVTRCGVHGARIRLPLQTIVMDTKAEQQSKRTLAGDESMMWMCVHHYRLRLRRHDARQGKSEECCHTVVRGP